MAGEQQPAEPEGVAQLAASAGPRPVALPAGAASSSAMRASRSRMNAPTTVSGDGRAPSVRPARPSVADADLQERAAQRRLDLLDVEVQLVGPDADQRASRTRSGSPLLARGSSMSAGCVPTVAASSSSRSKRVLPTCRSSTVTAASPSASSSVDEQHLAGPVLVERDGFGAPA